MAHCRLDDVYLRHMNAALAQASHQLDPEAVAEAVRHANDQLAECVTIPPRISAIVRGLGEDILASGIDEWLAIEPYHALLVHRAVLEAQETLATPGDADARDRLRLSLDRLASALVLVTEADPVGEHRSTKEIAQWLDETVDVSQRELAELLGVDLRKFQRWISRANSMNPEGEDARRVRTVARVANQLRHTLSGPGVVAWFGWPRGDLSGKTPRDLLNDVSKTPDLLLAAGSTRSTALS